MSKVAFWYALLRETRTRMNFILCSEPVIVNLNSAQPWLYLLLLVQIFCVANKFGNYLPLSVSFVLVILVGRFMECDVSKLFLMHGFCRKCSAHDFFPNKNHNIRFR